VRLEKTKIGLTLVAIYATLAIAAYIFLVLQINDTPFAGIYITLLTAPWSFIETEVLDHFGVIDKISIATKNVSLVMYVILNALIIYCITSKIVGVRRWK